MSGQGWAAAALITVLVPLTTWALLRDLTRAVQRRRTRTILAAHAAAFDALKATVGLTLLPHLIDMAAIAAEAHRITTRISASVSDT